MNDVFSEVAYQAHYPLAGTIFNLDVLIKADCSFTKKPGHPGWFLQAGLKNVWASLLPTSCSTVLVTYCVFDDEHGMYIPGLGKPPNLCTGPTFRGCPRGFIRNT